MLSELSEKKANLWIDTGIGRLQTHKSPPKSFIFITTDSVIMMEDKHTGEFHQVLKCRFRRILEQIPAEFNENMQKYSKNIVKFGAFVELII